MKKLLFFFICISVISCQKKYNVQRSFCYWKTSGNNNLLNIDGSAVDSLNVKHMYMRFFDVDWNPYAAQPLPVATSWSFVDNDNRLEITPSVYITNKAILNSSRQQLEKLAVDISKRINVIIDNTRDDAAMHAVYKYNLDYETQSCLAEEKQIFDGRINEILIDCDWTLRSKENYFFLLKELKKAIPQYTISATIRLWQYRDFELAGIPPADRGLLMCYNMEDPASRETKNSIGSSQEFKKYITHSDYPLNLDVALPLFRWTLAYRDRVFLGIIPEENIDITHKYYDKIDNTHYRFNRDIVLGETYFRNGDEIRIEQVSGGDIKKMIDVIKNNIDLEDAKVTFFSWDNNIIKSYGTKTISGYYALFGS